MSDAKPSPRLSVVATSRNDDHGLNLKSRMQLFVDGFADQAERFRMPLELILVEWNPPEDRAPLATVLRWPPGEYFQPQVITVPGDVHNAFPHSEGLPLFQMIAKNVGIRRSHAPYVLATNIDILLSDELFEFLGNGLEPNSMYRVDRHDIEAHLERPALPSPADCRALPPIRMHTLEGLRYPKDAGPATNRSASAPALLRQPIRELSRLGIGAWSRLALPKLHTSGCGDFTLTSKETWSTVRGYAEWPYFSWHIDGVLLFQAYAAGARTVNLQPPMAALHLEHSAGSGWTPEASGKLFERLDAVGVPYLSTNDYRLAAWKIVRGGRRSPPINGPDWGLASHTFATTRPG